MAGSTGTRTERDAKSVSIVVPVFNEAECIGEFHRRTSAVADELGFQTEFVYVDDGSSDQSAALLAAIAADDPRVSVLRLSRNFGHQTAVTAGLDYASGDAVVVIDADLQDPPEVIPELVEAWEKGAQIVHAVRASREGETRFKRRSASIFYRLIARWSEIDLQVDAGDFRLYDKTAVEALRSMPESSRFIRGMASWIGFQQTPVFYTRQSRYAGSSKYPLRKMVRLATDALTGYSIVPLRVASYFGFLTAMLAFAAIPIIAALRLFNVVGLGGQTTVIVVALFVGGIQMLFLGVLGEYVGRISSQVKQRPLYLIQPVGTVRAEKTVTPPHDVS